MGPFYASDPRPAFAVVGGAVATMDDSGSDVRVDLSDPQSIDDVRTLTVGDRVRIPTHGDWCSHSVPGGFVCSRTRGHDPHNYPHAAATSSSDLPGTGEVLAVADPEPADDPRLTELQSRLTEAEHQQRLSGIRAERAQERANRAEEMISSIREYALEKMRDGTICRDGTREFLQHFDLPGFERRYSVQVLVTVETTSEDDGDDAAEDARTRVSNAVHRYLDNVQDVTVNDWDDLGEADD